MTKETEVLQTLAENCLDPKRKRDDKRARQELAGIPDSKPFIDPQGPTESKMESYHIDGVLISELKLMPQVLAALDYHCTDEGIAERNARPEVREPSGIEMVNSREKRRWVGASRGSDALGNPVEIPAHFEYSQRSTDDFGKALDQREHEVKDREFPDYVARDPLREVAARFTAPGMRPKFLSSSVKDSGDTGDYELVKYPEGNAKAGEPVRAKGMFLGQMPERMAKAKTEKNRQRGNVLLAQIEQKHKSEGGLVDPG